jgi:hypothetical protein
VESLQPTVTTEVASMSSSKRTADAPNATRQMLDELDALMERMLSLPVNDGSEPPPPALAATLTVVPETEGDGVQPPSLQKIRSMRRARQEEPTYRTEVEAPPSEARPPVWDRSEPMPPDEEILPPLADRPPTPSKSYTDQRRSWGSWLYQPLIWINQVYDRSTQWLGPMGRWLRGTSGRMLVGYVGLILFCLALAWGLRDWITTW